MSANTSPIYSRTAHNDWGTTALTAANTAMDGTGTVLTVFTADATEGSFLNEIVFRTAGTCVASVARIFLNNGSSNTTAANNVLIGEVSLPATTLTQTSAQSPVTFPWNKPIQAGYKINVVLGTAVSAGYYISAHGGKF